MNRIDRLFGIMTLLQGRKHYTAEGIAEHFGISVRTVYRDIKALGEQGIPVGFEPTKGYFLVQGYFLPPVSFSSEEANALLLMESVVSAFADKSIEKHYTTALNKVKAVLRTTQKEQLETLNKHISFHVPECFKYDQEYLSALQSAITSSHILELDYQNKEGLASKRQVEPIGLVFYAFSWHLIAWCHLRQEYRDFRVTRIQAMRCLDVPFKKQGHMSLSDFIEQMPKHEYEPTYPTV
jgi:predicted DNA-binding transcriptional regulator YafY